MNVNREQESRNRPFDIVAIDDTATDLAHLETVVARLKQPWLRLHSFADLPSALLEIVERKPDLIILDDFLGPEIHGETAITSIRLSGYHGPIAILSGLKRPGRDAALVRRGAFAHVDKDLLDELEVCNLIDLANAHSKLLKVRQ